MDKCWDMVFLSLKKTYVLFCFHSSLYYLCLMMREKVKVNGLAHCWSNTRAMAVLFLVLFLPGKALAQVDWLRALSSAWKVGKAVTITDEQLAEMVSKEVAYMDKQYTVMKENSNYAKRLDRVRSGIDSVEGVSLNFKVYKTTEANAFACPDGSVRVFSALMDALTDDELMGVLGHELGHVALKHSKKAWRSAILRSAASDALGAVSDTWAMMSDSFLGTLGSAVLSASHSKYHETQADDYGYDFLKAHGKNPLAMVKLFEKLKKLSKHQDNRYQKFLQAFSSHPDFDQRIKHLRERAKEDGY